MLSVAVKHGSQRHTRRPQARREIATEKSRRLALQFDLPVLVALEDRSRASTERTMIEEDDVVVEEKMSG
jgi:hypothetical protein